MQRAAAPTCVRLQHVNALHLQQQVHRVRLCKPEWQGRGDITITNPMALGGSKLHRSTSQHCNASSLAACLHCASCRTAQSAPLGPSGRRLAALLPAAPRTPRQSRLQQGMGEEQPFIGHACRQ